MVTCLCMHRKNRRTNKRSGPSCSDIISAPDIISAQAFDVSGVSECTVASNHTCDKLRRGIREVFLSFPGGF